MARKIIKVMDLWFKKLESMISQKIYFESHIYPCNYYTINVNVIPCNGYLLAVTFSSLQFEFFKLDHSNIWLIITQSSKTGRAPFALGGPDPPLQNAPNLPSRKFYNRLVRIYYLLFWCRCQWWIQPGKSDGVKAETYFRSELHRGAPPRPRCAKRRQASSGRGPGAQPPENFWSFAR